MSRSWSETAGGAGPLARLEWNEVREPGCYLHVSTGLLARVYAEDLEVVHAQWNGAGGGVVVRLDPNPGAPLGRLREIASHHGLSLSS